MGHASLVPRKWLAFVFIGTWTVMVIICTLSLSNRHKSLNLNEHHILTSNRNRKNVRVPTLAEKCVTTTPSERVVPATPLSSSASRWEKQFYNLFDQPNPLASCLGPYNRTFPNKYVIYRCDNETMSPCGGWGDRVRGMMTAFIVANLTGRVFKAEIITPGCDFHRFIQPNRVNWSLPVSLHKRVQVNDTVKILDMWGSPHFYKIFSEIDWLHHSSMLSDFLYMKSNNDNMDNFQKSKVHANALSWMKGSNGAAINRFLFTHLFRPNDQLRSKVVSFLSENVNPGENLICSHLRIGRNPSNPLDYYRMGPEYKHLFRLWKLMGDLVSKYEGNAKIFFMSDSDFAIGLAKQQKAFASKIFTYSGKIVHLDLASHLNKEEICDGFEKIVFEQMVLFHCDALIISDSGIGRLGAYVRGSDNELYCLVKQRGMVSKCTLDAIKNTIYKTRN